MSDTRVLPYSTIRLYNAGQGDPRVTDHGFGWYDILAQTWQRGAYQYDSNGLPLVEFLPEIGLVCRPFPVPFDTRLSQYTTVNGAWDESRPGTGAPRVFRLIQGDSTPGVQYSATSNFSLPQNPSVCIALSLPDTPPDWDGTTYPPYVSVEFGSGWRLFFSKNCNQLQRKVAGLWVGAADIQQPAHAGDYGDEDNEIRLFLRCLRGKVGISADGGFTYTWAANADGSAITVPGAPIVLRGQGGECAFGLWQLLYSAGRYTSPTRNTLRSRVSATATFTPRGLTPAGTSIAFADLSVPAAGVAQYQATLTPKSTPGVPFTFWATPELYALGFSYPVVSVPGDGTYTTPWDGQEMKWDVTEPLDLAQASASLELKQPADTEIPDGLPYDFRRVEIYAGATQAEGDPTSDLLFVGYVATFDPTQSDFGWTAVRMTLESAAARFRRTRWSALDIGPLGGRTVNEALDYVLASEGLNASYRAWHVLGDRLTLPLGTPEDPFELIKPNEAKWDTMVRISGYVNLELGVLRDGTFTSVPRDFVAETEHTYTPTGTELLGTYAGLSHGANYAERATAVLVTGTDVTGATLVAWAVDEVAEQVPDSGRFMPWRVLRQEDVGGTCDLGVLAARAQALAYQCFSRKLEPDLQLPVDLSLSRRDRVIITGEAARGIPDGTAHVILSLKHSYDSRGTLAGLRTAAGIRRLNT